MLKSFALATSVFALGGCAGIGAINSEVSTYGSWPAERKVATYAFERLPSQQEHADEQKLIEESASGALALAGFTPADTPADAQVTVQVGARVGTFERWPYADPFWRNVSVGYFYGLHRGIGRWGVGIGAGYSGWSGSVGYEREVELFIRDQKTGQLLYEARARNNGASSAIGPLLPAMFSAALKDFPDGGPNPRSVNVEFSKQ